MIKQIGKMGNGKSLIAIDEAYKALKKGKSVYSNYPLNIKPPINLKLLDWRDIK